MSIFRKIAGLPFSILFGTITSIRNFAYNSRIAGHIKPSVPSVGIGNLSTGGTGKTMISNYLLELLKQSNIPSIYLSRGYGRKSKGYVRVFEETTFWDAGDEALMIKKLFPETLVLVCERRKTAIKNLNFSVTGKEVLLLDDIFQHRSVQPGINILLTEYHHPFFGDFPIPAGNLREFGCGAKRADILIVTKCPQNLTEIQKSNFLSQLRFHLPENTFFTSLKYSNPEPMKAKQTKISSFSKEMNVLGICGIGNSAPFRDYLDENFTLRKLLKYGDHHIYNRTDLKEIVQEFEKIDNSNKIVITTKKDAVRFNLPEFENILKEIPFFVLPVEVEFLFDSKEKFNNYILTYARQNKTNQ